MRFSSLIVAFCSLLFMQTPQANAQDTSKVKDPKTYIKQICLHIQETAKSYNIPEAFFARLLWQESRFNPNAVSPKGAQGIAQFMPATANERGLEDPFNPLKSIEASASYLTDLKSELGTWGLAAGGYNAGPNRVKAWLYDLSTLPFETRNFISIITGYSANEWKAKTVENPQFVLKAGTDFLEACEGLPANKEWYLTASLDDGLAPVGKWGVILASHFSRNKALSIFNRLQGKHKQALKGKYPSIARRVNKSFGSRPRYEIQLAATSRDKANRLCGRLRMSGLACVVLRN